MAFSSVQFLFVFLPLSLAVYWLCPKWLRNAVLAAFSLQYLAWAGLKAAAILVLQAGITWLGGLSLGRLAHKRPLLILLILLDLAVLGGFKYAGFAAETVNALVPGLLPVLSPALPLETYSRGMGAMGLPGDLSSPSRFVRTAYTRLNSRSGDGEAESASQRLHILGAAAQQRGCCVLEDGACELTLYTSCCNADTGGYYYTTYDAAQLCAVDMHRADLDGTALACQPLDTAWRVHYQN